MSEWITANEAATLAKCTTSHVYNMIRKGALRARRKAVFSNGKHLTLIRRSDVLREADRIARIRQMYWARQSAKRRPPATVNVGDTVAIDRRLKRNNRQNNPPSEGVVVALYDGFASVRMPAGYVESFHYDQLEVVRTGGSDKKATAATVAE